MINFSRVFTFCLLMLYGFGVFAQALTNSNLPIVVINTGGSTIPDEPKIVASMGVIYNGEGATNNINDPYNHYNGNIGIETRGNSTQDFDKKTYSIELRTAVNQDTSVNLLGMGKEEDWILHAMVIDKSQLRIPMSFYWFQQMGHYAANWRYVEVIIDNDYRGLYILTEKIKRDDDRVNIAKLDQDDLAGDSLTGGYILRIDWLENPQGFESNYNAQSGDPMFFQWYYPKATQILTPQANYIASWIDTFEEALFSPSFYNNQGIRYSDYINLNSFTDFLIINELSKNSDGYKLSTYLHKDKDSKGGLLNAGPVWDFDQTYGLSDVCSNFDYTGWTYLQNQNGCEDLESMPMWWQKMMSDSIFQDHLTCRWQTFRQTFLHKDSINLWIDNDTTFIAEAINRNFTKWDDFIGESIWAEPEPIPQSYKEEITYLKTWISNRIDWLDANFPGQCSTTSLSKTPIEDVLIYPNPVKDILFIKPNQNISTKIYDFQGRLVLRGNSEIDISNLQNGVYMVAVTTANAVLHSTIIKQ